MLSIRDNGKGFEVPKILSSLAPQGKLGLVGIDERIKLLNGDLNINSELGQGTSIQIEVPA
jgi:signal transduction histidine kinase